MSPYLPVAPDRLLDEIYTVCDAVATVVHIHVENAENGLPSADREIFLTTAWKAKKFCGVIPCTTTGGRHGEPVVNRLRVVTSYYRT